MTQALVREHEAPLIGSLEAPSITFLGSLDDDQGTEGLGIETDQPKPVLAIIYPGI